MSLQTRLAALVAAVGADIKADRARLTSLEGTPTRQTVRGSIQASGGYSNLTSGVLPSSAQRVDLPVVPGTYIIHVSMAAYHTAIASAHWNLYARKPDGTFITAISNIAFYLNIANVHTTFAPASGEITITTAGTLSLWPGIGALSTTEEDRFDVVLIPKDTSGPPGPAGPTGPQGVPGDAPASYTMDTWHYIGAAGEPAFQNGWVHDPFVSGAGQRKVRFRKDPFGRVQIEGVAGSGSVASTMFVLPAGYRPPFDRGIPIVGSAGPSNAGVTTAGVVTSPTGTALSFLFFDSAEFDTDTVTTFLSGPKGDKGDVGSPPIVVRAKVTTSFTPTPATVYGPISFATEDSDTDNLWNGSRFQPTKAGWYEIIANLLVGSISGSSGLNSLYLTKNGAPGSGTSEFQDTQFVSPSGGGITNSLSLSHLIYFNGTTDYAEIYVQFVSGQISSNSYFMASAIGAAGPKGDTGETGATGPTGAPGASGLAPQIDWQELDLTASVWTPVSTYAGSEPSWMMSAEGMVFMRGLVEAHTGSTGMDFVNLSSMFEPFTAPEANRVTIPGVNQTQEEIGYWEVLSSGIVWHGPVADGDILGLDGLCWPSFINGPLGQVIVPTFASGWSSDPLNPLKVWVSTSEIRFVGSVIGTLSPYPAATTMFSVAGLPVHNRIVQGNATLQTISGAQHPDTTGLSHDSFSASSAGAVQILGPYDGVNQVNVTLHGGFTMPEPE